MEETKLQTYWKRIKPVLILFCIRLIEVFASGVIPSFIGSWITLLNPNLIIWYLTQILVFVLFFMINCRFLLRYIASGRSRTEFYVLNMLVYVIYCYASLELQVLGPVVYSHLFLNMRAFEVVGFMSKESIYLTNIITILTMLLFGITVNRRADRKSREILSLAMKLGGIRPDEQEELFTPERKGRKVERMTNSEMASYLEREMKTEQERLEAALGSDEGIWSKDMKRGDGSEIVYFDPDDPENDFDEHGNVQENWERYNALDDYTGDNLWGDIYKGKEKVVDFADDEPEPPPIPPRHIRVRYTLRHHAESFRQLMNLRRKKDEITEFIDNLYYEKLFLERGERTADSTPAPRTDSGEEEYDSDNLWSVNMSKGRQSPNT